MPTVFEELGVDIQVTASPVKLLAAVTVLLLNATFLVNILFEPAACNGSVALSIKHNHANITITL